MNFGFVIDNRNCIGCHACSTACKSENDVPLGVYRTWVKYTETGAWPEPQRHFQVTRCNHCSNPPCTRICPTEAMYQRDDGIVEFDGSACIGCKACLQACPYDAIYIDPETNTAAKCHYCSHRTDRGLEPACVVVCPTHAIISGDMDDPTSEISSILAREKVTVRKPEQGTAPKLFYIEGSAVSMHPTATERDPGTFMWADVRDEEGQVRHDSPSPPPTRTGDRRGESRGAERRGEFRTPQMQGLPEGGPIVFGGKQAGHMTQVSYNAQHKVPWHWPVPAYLVTKGIAAGIILLVALATFTGVAPHGPTLVAASGLSLVFLGLTTLLLVFDLEKPQRFLYILLRPQWRSWLTRGAVVLIVTSLLGTAWFGVELCAHLGWLQSAKAGTARLWLLGMGVPAAVATAVYTAFLFGQAEGRDLWQSPMLPIHLLVQAILAGAAALLILVPFVDMPAALESVFRIGFALALAVDLLVLFFAEMGMPHASEVAARAAQAMHAGKYSTLFWAGAVFLGHAVPLSFFLIPPAFLPGAAVCALVGLYAYEHAFVMAPQEIPNA
jgi:Fe-S-cluster-containing dehydrogenase component/formate-dependent nitrite reductase membrane component NrfD